MKYGVMAFVTDQSIRPDDLARAAEERGFESLFFPEHTHIPSSTRTIAPSGRELPDYYSRTLDLFSSLTAAAMATTKLKIGSGICLVIERDPIVLAKEISTLDLLSGGRFIFGIGGGWNAEEMGNHGATFKTRWQLLRERIEAMKQIWSQDEAEYHGKFVNFDPIRCWPKPLQKPHPPILLGARAPWAFNRVVQYCDGWMPNSDLSELPNQIATLRKMAQEAGRDPNSISISIFGAPSDKASLNQFAELGVERVMLRVPSGGADVVLPALDENAKLIS